MDNMELPKELKERARNCESAEDLAALAQAEGIELSFDQLDVVTGGFGGERCNDYTCRADT